jgi:hypothetical protein
MPEPSNHLGPGPQPGPSTNPPAAQPPTWGRHDDQIPSVGCLLYLVADEVIEGTGWHGTKVPCRRAWVTDRRFAATVMTATYLSLRNSGHLALALVEVPAIRSRRRTTPEVTRSLLKATPPPGVPGVVLNAMLGTGPWPRTSKNVGRMVRNELVELDYARYGGIFFRPDCAKLAMLQASVCSDAVHWWQWAQVAEAPLVSRLLKDFWAAFRPEGGGV